jgi:DNA polymerase III subunit gamma/tau
MSYQVLARKWRPQTFQQVVGQTHVLRALVNALDTDRLHHAYLFTGTRGVGKTSLARVFAKSLNCEKGVSSEPCGECGSCVEVDEGRFVDLIEVDAASRTKVDETRELLDNVQYAATRGRYKVYLIDEVHMFSTHSFNALLKTLEEPPPHVKFLLATTDPKKLPVTILSRCLQFNLKRVAAEELQAHLAMITQAEGVKTDAEALAQIAKAADGSVRDALSLMDQAIAYGAGEVNKADVTVMLGTIAGEEIIGFLDALAIRDGGKLISLARQLAETAPDYQYVIGELLSYLRRVAVVQALESDAEEVEDNADIKRLAAIISPEDVQLFYQIGLIRLLPECAGAHVTTRCAWQ